VTRTAVEALRVLREQTQRTISELARDFEAVVEASAHTNADDEHDPEGSTIAFERAQLGALLASARQNLAEIDDAIDRVGAGTYGQCEACGVTISRERLEARPAARWCVTCASVAPSG